MLQLNLAFLKELQNSICQVSLSTGWKKKLPITSEIWKPHFLFEAYNAALSTIQI